MTIRCFWLEPTGEEVRKACDDNVCHGVCARQGYCVTFRPFRRADTGEVRDTISAFGAGAMWDATWMHDVALPEAEVLARRRSNPDKKYIDVRRHADGRVLCVETPGGTWMIDQISAQGNFWTRSGEPPDVTANPSIICSSYHGWLRNGVLTEV